MVHHLLKIQIEMVLDSQDPNLQTCGSAPSKLQLAPISNMDAWIPSIHPTRPAAATSSCLGLHLEGVEVQLPLPRILQLGVQRPTTALNDIEAATSKGRLRRTLRTHRFTCDQGAGLEVQPRNG